MNRVTKKGEVRYMLYGIGGVLVWFGLWFVLEYAIWGYVHFGKGLGAVDLRGHDALKLIVLFLGLGSLMLLIAVRSSIRNRRGGGESEDE